MKINLFSTPIYQFQFDGELLEKIQEEFQVVYDDHVNNNKFQDPFRDRRMELSNGTFNADIFTEYQPMVFLNNLSVVLKDYVSDFVQTEYDAEIRASWMTRMQLNQYCHIHSHSDFFGAHISGVYYFKAQPDDANLFFETPVNEAAFTPIGNHATKRILRRSSWPGKR